MIHEGKIYLFSMRYRKYCVAAMLENIIYLELQRKGYKVAVYPGNTADWANLKHKHPGRLSASNSGPHSLPYYVRTTLVECQASLVLRDLQQLRYLPERTHSRE